MSKAINSKLFLGNIICPLEVCCHNNSNDEAPLQTHTYLLPEETSNKPNSWVEAIYEQKLCDGGVVCRRSISVLLVKTPPITVCDCVAVGLYLAPTQRCWVKVRICYDDLF